MLEQLFLKWMRERTLPNPVTMRACSQSAGKTWISFIKQNGWRHQSASEEIQRQTQRSSLLSFGICRWRGKLQHRGHKTSYVKARLDDKSLLSGVSAWKTQRSPWIMQICFSDWDYISKVRNTSGVKLQHQLISRSYGKGHSFFRQVSAYSESWNVQNISGSRYGDDSKGTHHDWWVQANCWVGVYHQSTRQRAKTYQRVYFLYFASHIINMWYSRILRDYTSDPSVGGMI